MEACESDIVTDSASMRANTAIMIAEMDLYRDRDGSEQHFIEAENLLDKALEPDPYWADYFLLKERITRFLHDEFGCRIVRRSGTWEINCIDVSNALHIPGISRSERFDLECSICGKDPLFCAHIPGQIYEGRLAVGVVKNLEFVHLALTDLPEERNVGIYPRPLTDSDIKEFFPEGKAGEILSKGQMRCKDLVRVVRQKDLGGVNFVRPHRH
jgi:hypothetical protein